MVRRLFLGFLLFALPAFSQQFDYLIRHGRVVDGSGRPYVYADVGVVGDRITLVGRAPANATAKQVIDATGLIVAPGFIDMLGQSELNLLIDRRAVSKLTQGVTTEITGEGESIAPQSEATVAEMREYLEHYRISMDWRDLEGYFQRLEQQGSGINLATYVGAAQVREVVMGDADRAPTPEELQRMQDLVDQQMRQGAMGLSTALIYAPGNYARTDELIALAKVAAKYGGVYATHIRSEADTEAAALQEAFRIGREAHLPVEIFHLKVSGRQHWGGMQDVADAINGRRALHEGIAANQYPYLAGATSLGAAIPPQYHAGGANEFIVRLKDPALRAEIRRRLTASGPQDFENWWRLAGGPEGILVNSVLRPELKPYEGKTIAEIAAMQRKDPLDALLDLVIADGDNTGAIYFVMSERDVVTAMSQPWVSVGTDFGAVAPDGPLADSRAHPRAYGTFPRILSRYTRLPERAETGALSERPLTLEAAIRKFTSLPAQRMHLANRGLLRTGYFADITIFDPLTIKDVATYEDPNRPSVGIECVFVNGVLSVERGRLTGQVGGRPLRGPGYEANHAAAAK
jgi:dihydroorotase/N-acyl-D-amino-acid deacylase